MSSADDRGDVLGKPPQAAWGMSRQGGCKEVKVHLPYNKNLTANAKILRNNQTDEEKKLWYQYLSSYPVRFTRQKVIDNCILDFYCAKCRIGIELDGKHHFTENGIGQDNARTELLNAYGVTILRFTNEQVRNDFGYVCSQIDQAVKALLECIKLGKRFPTSS